MKIYIMFPLLLLFALTAYATPKTEDGSQLNLNSTATASDFLITEKQHADSLGPLASYETDEMCYSSFAFDNLNFKTDKNTQLVATLFTNATSALTLPKANTANLATAEYCLIGSVVPDSNDTNTDNDNQ